MCKYNTYNSIEVKESYLRSRILCVHIEPNSLRAEFVNKYRCISVCLVSVEEKSI